MAQDLKQIIREEYLKCAQDPAHFMKKYCHIQHPQRGRIIFNLYPFQEKVLHLWRDNPYDIILKSRQLGISTLVAGYSLWLMLFQKDKNILCIATKQETAKNMVTKVKFMFENLPSWLKITAEGGAIVLSTPYGTGNWFHQTWVKAESGENQFLPIKLPWYVHPERDETWRKRQDELLGDPRMAAQECDCDFNTSGDVVFYPEYIDFITSTYVKEPLERRGADQNLWIWEPADYTRSYMVIADVARGDGKDFSAFHIIDVETNTQVGEYKGQLSPKEFGYFLVGIATEYNEALLVVENANIGWSTIDAVQERGYRNLYYSPKSETINADSYLDKFEDPSKMTPGFTMSLKSRPLVINKFREYIGDKSVVIQSKRLVEEMKVFVWKNGRAEAQSGYNDDLVMSFGIAMYVRDTALKFKTQGMDLTRAMLSNIVSVKPNQQGAYVANKYNNPYNMDFGQGPEDISWLL